MIKKGNILKDIHKQYIMYQLLKSTMYLHSGNVIHRDHKVKWIKGFTLSNASFLVLVALG